MMPSPEELLVKYQGQIVPLSFNAGYVALSYIVSWVGAASTLELINRRTSRNGVFNHLILFASAITMGGIAIWCMHFIGNRALELADGEDQLQIAYSSGFTALSFFLPILVLLAAFVAIGAHNRVSWWRIGIGGSLAGAAICGMHYLGDASIANYTCEYAPANVVGATLIAVAATNVALALFFVFRASWTNSWWKRGLTAVVLAGAVSGMHWCASTGTRYRLLSLNDGRSQLSRNSTAIVVICLSISAAFVMAASAVWTARSMRRYADKAQQVVLAAAVFDTAGRILVNSDGLVPSEKITDTYLEKTPSDIFNIAHPLFHWMFQASRNWDGLRGIIGGMAAHLASLSNHGGGNGGGKSCLIDSNGELVEHYDVVLRELFCQAALSLADKMKEDLANVGVLWDEILPTGANGLPAANRNTLNADEGEGVAIAAATRVTGDMLEKGEAWGTQQQQQQQQQQAEYGRGSLMFLVRRVDRAQDTERLEAAGYRFADVRQVSGIIGSSMQIKARDLNGRLASMAAYAEGGATMLDAGGAARVHVGLFGVKARVGPSSAPAAGGFNVLVRNSAQGLLPSVALPQPGGGQRGSGTAAGLDSWQMDVLRRVDGLRVAPELLGQLASPPHRLAPTMREREFLAQLRDAVVQLRAWVGDPVVDQARISATVVQVPCRRTRTSMSSNSSSSLGVSGGGGGRKSSSIISSSSDNINNNNNNNNNNTTRHSVSSGVSGVDGNGGSDTCSMIALHLLMPIHTSVRSTSCHFSPLTFFKIQQAMALRDSPAHAAFSRFAHREMGPIINGGPGGGNNGAPSPAAALASSVGGREEDSHRGGPVQQRLASLARRLRLRRNGEAEASPRKRQQSSATSTSEVKLWAEDSNSSTSRNSDDGNRSENGNNGPNTTSTSAAADDYSSQSRQQQQQKRGPLAREAKPDAPASAPAPQQKHAQSSYGGIMVSQEITVDVRDVDAVGASKGGGAGGVKKATQRQSAAAAQRRRSGSSPSPTPVGGRHRGGHQRQRTATGRNVADLDPDLDSELELKPLPGTRRRLDTTVESDRGAETPTFVDELFALCLDAR